MLPKGITEEEFIYNSLDSKQVLDFYNKFNDLLKDFAHTIKQKGKLEVNLSIIGRISIRVDQRKDYYMYYHSTEGKIMRMSHEKEMALWSYWVSKYKPVRFVNPEDDEVFFSTHGCTISDAFAAYIIISIVCANNKKRAKYFKDDVVLDLYYDFANRDFSKEALISRVEDLIH